MSRVEVLRAVLIVAFLGACAVVVDALIVTDEERLEAFVESFDGELDDDRVDNALAYVDPIRQPVTVTLAGETISFGDGDEQELAAAARETLSPFYGSEVRLVQDAIELDDESAHVAIRASTREGLVDAQFWFERHEGGWLVSRVRVN